MDLNKTGNGKWQLRWREAGRRRARTFDRKQDALDFDAWRRRRKQLGMAAVADDIELAEFVQDVYWPLHAIPNLTPATRQLYARTWANHVHGRLGGFGVRELSPKRIARFREDLERAGVGTATVVKAMTVVQSILSVAIAEEIVEFNAAAAVKKPAYEREREPHIFTPADVERIRVVLDPRSAVLVSLLAYSGPRPEEALRLTWRDIGSQAIRYRDTKRRTERYTPLLAPLGEDLAAWYLESGRPAAKAPVIPRADGEAWTDTDWKNWRNRVWKGEPERARFDRKTPTPPRPGVAPAGSRPRDLRSSYVTVHVYAGVPLTEIARNCGTSVRMIERHYAGTIANWDGRQVPAVEQVRAARRGRRLEAL